jgi:ethylbenzene hydroxylase subunit beta/complex iron-sulfur molybdoenzyme family reductase subunit beta
MSERQLAMVMYLTKCIGCQTRTIACKRLWTRDEGMEPMWWNTVNTQPGRGTPRDWEEMGGGFREGVPRTSRLPTRKEFGEAWNFNYDEVFHGGKGDRVHLKVEGEAPDWGPNWDEDQGAGEYPNAYYFYLPRICNHCTHPACLEACPRKAIVKRDEDGIVLIDEDRCRGYRFCMEACPYKKIYFNHATKVAQKCIFCFPRIEQGVARDDTEAPIWKLVDQWKVALPLHPEYGTDPNVFYVPPLAPPRYDENGDLDESKPRIPDAYLISLFGPKVMEALGILKAEMAKTRSGQPSELMDLLIAYRWKDMFGGFDRDPATIEWTKS